jgi:DNA-binding winged helix-turn-helix (wHTH) protein
MKSGRGAAPADGMSAGEYSFGPFRLDVRKRRLWKGDQIVALTPKALDTLLALVQRAGQVVDRDDLLQIVWPDTFISEETLTQNIATIRRALGDSSEHPRYIVTIPRRGYRFIDAVTSGPVDAIPPVATSEPSRPEWPAHAVDVVPSRRRPLLIGGTLVAMMVSVGLGLTYYLRARGPEPTFGGEWHINPPPGTALVTGGVLSPDGRSIAFVTIDAFGTTGLSVQTLGSLDSRRLPGTDGARAPFWSSEGKSIIFSAAAKLKRIGLGDELPQTLANVSLAHFLDHGGASSPAGILLCATTEEGPLQKFKPDGTFEPVTRMEAGELVHLWPSFLPDGRHFLYRAGALDDDEAGTYVGSLDSPDEKTRLDGVDSAAVYDSGYVLFVREGALVAQAFDPERRQLQGTPLLVAPNVSAPHPLTGGMTFSASAGIFSYIAGGTHHQLAWFDRGGRPIGGLENTIDMLNPSLSPDDAQVAAGHPKNDVAREVWIAPTSSGTPWRLGTGLPESQLPVWSHDGQRIAFISGGNLYSVAAAGGHPELLAKAPSGEQPLRLQDWSRDDRFLVYFTTDPKTAVDLWWFSMTDRKAHPFLRSPGNQGQAQLSPNGHWLAYASDETGRNEIYVQQFPEGEAKQKISVNGGMQPQWRRDGNELFYLSFENKLMSVSVRPTSPPHFGSPRELFQISLQVSLKNHRNDYAVSRDGSRFLVSVPPQNPPPITVRLNWTAALHK